jgi:hypothetical protein
MCISTFKLRRNFTVKKGPYILFSNTYNFCAAAEFKQLKILNYGKQREDAPLTDLILVVEGPGRGEDVEVPRIEGLHQVSTHSNIVPCL